MKSVLMFLVRAYRTAISPLFPPRCRFLPSCSDYALQAIERHGALAGGWLALRRFLRCNPLNPGGIDEVPEINITSAVSRHRTTHRSVEDVESCRCRPSE